LGQVVASHATQVPAPSQTLPPFWVHAVPAGLAGCDGVPPVQASVVHWLPSSAGRSVSSATVVVPPCPSQTVCWQSPGVWLDVGVPELA
jgi:hypothetical protein